MRAIGYFLGVALGAPLLFFIVSFIFLRPRKVSSPEIFGAAFIGRAFFLQFLVLDGLEP